MKPKHLAVVLLLAMLGLIGYGAYRQLTNEPVLHATGRLLMRADEIKADRSLELSTRDISLAGVRRWQVELTGGTWIDCEGDCRSAVLRAGPRFWEEQQRKSR